jgi:hypothetical protein
MVIESSATGGTISLIEDEDRGLIYTYSHRPRRLTNKDLLETLLLMKKDGADNHHYALSAKLDRLIEMAQNPFTKLSDSENGIGML